MNTRKKKQRTKRIFKKSLALELIHRGCHLIDMEFNYKTDKHQVFVFKHDKHFGITLNQIIKETYF